jgi:negative regulator of flagellin synthesis FlgM
MTRIDGLNPLISGRLPGGTPTPGVDGSENRGGAQSAGAARRQDVVSLSDRGRVVAIAARAVGDSRDVRAAKVAALKAAIAGGSYRSNAREIATRLIANGFGTD